MRISYTAVVMQFGTYEHLYTRKHIKECLIVLCVIAPNWKQATPQL